MSLPRLTYLVELDSQPGIVHTVEIRPADQMVAEQTGPRFGLPRAKDAPITYTYVWAWAAMRRCGYYSGEWPEFQAELAAIQPDEDTAAGVLDPDEVPMVDPTSEAVLTASP